MKIVVFKYADSVFCEEMIFEGGRANVNLPISFLFYLIQTENRNILVDVGCDNLAGFPHDEFIKPATLLESYGILKEDVTDIIITHSHSDHVQAASHYKNATIYIQKDEYENAKGLLLKNKAIVTFDEEYMLEKNIIAKKIGGHSIGSSIVIADNYVFCGDECYLKKSLTDKIPVGASCCKEKSKKFIETYSNKKYIPLLLHDPNISQGKVGYKILKES